MELTAVCFLFHAPLELYAFFLHVEHRAERL